MITLYGIPNCDTMKKARQWLTDNNIEYTFHDYKKLGVPEKELKNWVKQLGWENVLNRSGTTWRKLDDKTRENISEISALRIMLDNPSIIKRPLLDIDGRYTAGYSVETYKKLFGL